MTVEYIDVADYVAIAAEVTGLDVDVVLKIADLGLADSALHAPSAGFGEDDFYPDFVGKAAVLVLRLVKNHSLPDGNKRAGWVALRLFVDLNGWSWDPKPDIDESETAVLAIASRAWDETEMAAWLRRHLRPPG